MQSGGLITCRIAGSIGAAPRDFTFQLNETVPTSVLFSLTTFGIHTRLFPPLYLRTRSQPHPGFRREGCDLTIERSVQLVDVLCGCTLTIAHLDGRSLQFSVMPGELLGNGGVKLIPGGEKITIDWAVMPPALLAEFNPVSTPPQFHVQLVCLSWLRNPLNPFPQHPLGICISEPNLLCLPHMLSAHQPSRLYVHYFPVFTTRRMTSWLGYEPPARLEGRVQACQPGKHKVQRIGVMQILAEVVRDGQLVSFSN